MLLSLSGSLSLLCMHDGEGRGLKKSASSSRGHAVTVDLNHIRLPSSIPVCILLLCVAVMRLLDWRETEKKNSPQTVLHWLDSPCGHRCRVDTHLLSRCHPGMHQFQKKISCIGSTTLKRRIPIFISQLGFLGVAWQTKLAQLWFSFIHPYIILAVKVEFLNTFSLVTCILGPNTFCAATVCTLYQK